MNSRTVSFLTAALAIAGAAHADDFGNRASFALFAGGNTDPDTRSGDPNLALVVSSI